MDNTPDGDILDSREAKGVRVKENVPRMPTASTPMVPISAGTKPQTIFIHKLYDMLEDSEISHLIWWAIGGDSFCLLPGEEFSKVLAQYFKHTNIASFIRQLNMYGFHKVNDQGQNESGGDPNVVKWEFRHLANHFRKGDVESLKLIKRRSSKNVTHSKEASALNRIPSSNDDDIVESTKENDVNPNDHHDVNAQEQQHYHQTLQLQQQDQMPQPSHLVQHHPIAPRDTILPANVLPSLSKLPHRYSQSNDISQEAKLQEVTNSLNTLRQDHRHLETQFDSVFNEQKKSQFDLIQLVEIMQRHAVKSDDDNELDYEFTNFKQVLLNKFNNLQAIHSQAQPSNQQPLTRHPQQPHPQQPHPQRVHSTMTPQLFSSSHLASYKQDIKNSSFDSNMDLDGQDKSSWGKNTKPAISDNIDSEPYGSINKDGQITHPHPDRFLKKDSMPGSLQSPHTSEMRSRSYQQYPFPNMNSDPRKSSPSSPEVFGSPMKQCVPLTSGNMYDQRPQSIPTPNSSISVSRLGLLSGSSGTAYSNIPAEGPPKLVPLPSVSELDKLIKNGGGLPFYSLLNSYESLKRKNTSDEEGRKRKS